ncbi:MAG: hypothetical protein HUJ68_09250 [Clostridia bacterium]|nr:hypothetical protein [Clostridia bacterium]
MADRMTPEKLKSLFLEVIQDSEKFSFLDGTQPFLMTFADKPFYIYIKHLSSAYFKDRPDTTRAQLPIRPDFDEIKKSSIPFIFLGYDISNDVYVCWNYHIAKNRLNEKESVSFYSRKSFQKEVKTGVFLRKKLKNDDIPVLFKRVDLISFFENIETFFEREDHLDLSVKEKSNPYERDGKLYKITELDLLEKIHSVVNEETNNILEGITLAKKYYGNKYPNMKYSDWSNLIKGTRASIIIDSENNSFKELLKNPEFRIDLGQNADRLVAEKYHCSTSDCFRARTQLGIEPYRKFEGGKVPKDIKQIISDYEQLGTLQKVADAYGCTKQALSLRLRSENIEIKKEKAKAKYITVKFPDGMIISERTNNETFEKVIKIVGIEKVRKMEIICCGINIITDKKDPRFKYWCFKDLDNGLYLFTNHDTQTKCKYLSQISDKFGLNLIISTEGK